VFWHNNCLRATAGLDYLLNPSDRCADKMDPEFLGQTALI
jgi:hypothetical protein